MADAAIDTHIRFGIFIGPSIDQQPRTVQVTIPRGINQRRASILCVLPCVAIVIAAHKWQPKP
jgi:hypothetical protein